MQIALLDPEQNRGGTRRGCDTVVAVQRPAPPADNAAEAALEALFAVDEPRVDGLYNFIAQTRQTLHLGHVTVTDGTARVYLSGRLSGFAGVCDNPRARIQIEETARRAPGVKDVALFLNGEPADLQPGGRGEQD